MFPFSVLENTRLCRGAQVGPFVHLRGHTQIGADTTIGNFVEIKNATLGSGVRAKHLAYIGDATLEAGVNIGAGAIICNYDGQKKHQTHIGAKAFIGSNASLVAPLSIGPGALIGAGSVITQDVPEGVLALARVRQRHLTRKV